MRSSAVIASLCAALAVASPVNKALLNKKAIVYDIVTDIVYVTVTEGVPYATPTPTTTVVIKHTVTASHSRKPKTKTSVAPVVVPTTSAAPVVVVAPTTSAAPVVVVETTSQAPAVQETTTPVQVKVAATTAAPATSSPTDYASTALYHHNMHRANHSASDLTWDDQLATYAKASANKCVFAHDMTEGGGGYGQNLAAYGTTTDIASLNLGSLVADSITNQWYYGEASAVPYGQDSPAVSGVPEFLHFTQVIWKATTKVGCATVQCPSGSIFGMPSMYTVCNYADQGNVLGAFTKNVVAPIGNAGITAKIS
jgi:uncharacterized protein YkwD